MGVRKQEKQLYIYSKICYLVHFLILSKVCLNSMCANFNKSSKILIISSCLNSLGSQSLRVFQKTATLYANLQTHPNFGSPTK